MENQGTLILVVGPSGVGKDTLLRGVSIRFQDYPELSFAKRVITRPENTGNEAHEPSSVEQFLQRHNNGEFWQTWQAHELHYALTMTVAECLQNGQSVVANISRSVIDSLIEKWPRTVVIEITAPAGHLQRRLEKRGRETAAQIQSRLNRVATPLSERATIHTLCNDGTREEGIDKFAQLILSLMEH